MAGQNSSRSVKFQYRVKLAQRVIERYVVLKSEPIKQLLRRILPAHHRSILRSCPRQNRSQPNPHYNHFFNTIDLFCNATRMSMAPHAFMTVCTSPKNYQYDC